MSGKIFRSILTVAIGTLLVTLLIITGCMYGYFGTVQENLLLDELSIAAQGTETAGEAFLTGLDSDNYRITWIAADGAVLFDNRADAAAMENHADREEIKAAFASGRGSSSRYSTTLTEKTLYEAVKLSDGTVLRISVSQVTVVVLLLGMIQPILLVAMLVIILSAILGKRMAKRIVEPLNRLDLERPMENDVYEELSPLLRRIDAQHREIRQQLTSLKQRRNEFTQITESMREGLVLLDNAGRIVSMNPAAKKLFHADRDSIGKDFLTLCRDQDMRRSIDEAEEVGHAELRTDVNGQEYQFDLSRIESDGEPMGEVILAFDITGRAEAERSRREFTANVSHELKTPL